MPVTHECSLSLSLLLFSFTYRIESLHAAWSLVHPFIQSTKQNGFDSNICNVTVCKCCSCLYIFNIRCCFTIVVCIAFIIHGTNILSFSSMISWCQFTSFSFHLFLFWKFNLGKLLMDKSVCVCQKLCPIVSTLALYL